MPRLTRRVLIALIGLFAATLSPPPQAGAWGTLTGGLHMSEAEQKKLRDLIDNYAEAGRKARILGQLAARIGAHPIHQFIVQQALLMLKEDPAVKDGQPGLPEVKAVNAWDGVERCEHGMRPTNGPGLVSDAPDLTPILNGAAGPGPDSELAVGGDQGAAMGYNAFYNGRAHYFSPFLDDGQAPAQAAANYSRLATVIVDGVPSDLLPHYAAYMAHYISDPISAKHADAFTLDEATIAALIAHANDWKKARTDDFAAWVATKPVTDAIATLEKRTAALSANSAAYWDRVEGHIANIGATPLFDRGGRYVKMAPSSVRTAVACFLRELDLRPKDKPVDQFYMYFDPFYFNGPVFQVKVDWTWGDYEPPSFQVCTPLSEHLFWETNPAQFELVKAWAGKDTPWLGGGDPRAQYVDWKPAKGFLDLDGEVGRKAMEETMAGMVRRCAQEAHGGLDDPRDWDAAFEGHLKLAIRCVATAFRASISAIRAESWGRRINDGADIRLQLSVKSAGGVPGKLTGARVAVRDPVTKLPAGDAWFFGLGDRPIGEEPVDIGVLLDDVPAGVALTDLVVDLRADFGALPDSGRARIPVTARGTKTVYNPSAAGLSAAKGPVDVIVVMDTTGSMGGSLDDLRRNAISSIRKLRERSSDLRLAVSVFRDLAEKDDLPHFVSRPFSRDLDAQFAFLNGLGAGGGGDDPEDQLHGISQGLRFWETETPDPDRVPTKIIVVITDAAAKSPDSVGNTVDSIAARSEAVDPAHIYPIVVGHDVAAAVDAKALAEKTGGRVLSAKSGDEVAAALIAAVDEAVVSYAAPAPRGGTRWGLFGVAALLLAAASLLAWMALRAGRRAARPIPGGQ